MAASHTFEQWIEAWKDEILQIQEHTKSELPASAHEIQADLSRTTRDYPRAAELLADVEGHLIRTRASETLHVKGDPKYADLTGPERKIVAESRLTDIQRVRDILKATCRALEERSFALLNQRRYEEAHLRMSPHGS